MWGDPSVRGRFSSQKTTNMEFGCFLCSSKPKQGVEWIVAMPVIWDNMMFMWHHCNVQPDTLNKWKFEYSTSKESCMQFNIYLFYHFVLSSQFVVWVLVNFKQASCLLDWHPFTDPYTVFALSACRRPSAGKKWARAASWPVGPASFLSFSYLDSCQRWDSGQHVVKP